MKKPIIKFSVTIRSSSRNPVARILANRDFSQRVARSRKIYTRKGKTRIDFG